MSSSKRKATADPPTNKSTTKRAKSDNLAKTSSKSQGTVPRKEDEKPAPKPATKSLLSKEQPAFPRGGASLLTPLEKKQIDARAWRDAQKEAGGQAGLFEGGGPDSEGSADIEDGIDNAPVSKKQKDKKKRADPLSKKSVMPKDTKIGGLSHKRLTVGSLILGQIIAISDRDLTVALPNNLIGFVPLTAISSQFTRKLETLLEADDESDGDEDENDNVLDLHTYFAIGQYVRVAVTSTDQDTSAPGSQSRKRIELSLRPKDVNAGLSAVSLVSGVAVQVSIRSVEDHGMIVDLDLESGSSQGFVPAKNLPEGTDLTSAKEGAVILCHVLKNEPGNKVVRVSANLKEQKVTKNAPTVESFLPGTIADILVTESQDTGVVGKIMGMLDVTADIVQSGAFTDKTSFVEKHKVGNKLRGRLIYRTGTSEDGKIGFSVLPNIMNLDNVVATRREDIGQTVTAAKVLTVEPGLGIYLDLGSERTAFAHVSRLADGKIEALSATTGRYKVGSSHSARITDYSALDGLHTVSLQQSILDQPFLRHEDVPAGEAVKVKIEKVIIGPAGIKGLIVKITDSISGFVPDLHLSDSVLQHPEKKFREGATVKARILSVDLSKRQVRLTLKKSLVNSDAKPWKSYNEIQVGDATVGTLVKVDPHGALVQFYSDVKGILPVAEMSEAFIKDAKEHFRVGQVLTVNAISVTPEERRLTVSCREAKAAGESTEPALESLRAGEKVTGTVFEKSENDVLLRLESSGTIARLAVVHVADGSEKKRLSALSKIRVGQNLEDLLVLDVQPKRRLVVLCNRKSIRKAATDGTLLLNFEELEVGKMVTGLISNITADGVYVSFASRISGMIPRSNLADGQADQPDFGLTKLQTISAKVAKVDYKGATPRFWLTLRNDAAKPEVLNAQELSLGKSLIEPLDGTLRTEDDLFIGRVTKARIASVRESQLNVDLAKDVQGRIDVSEVFDSFDDIKDRRKPLQRFVPKQVIEVRVLGAHDTRNHRFLPLSHRRGKNVVYELTAKPSTVSAASSGPLSYASLKPGDEHVAFVNNADQQYVWVNISPTVRGRIKTVDLSDDLSRAADLHTNFPTGAALKVRVLAVDAAKGRLDLTGRSQDVARQLTMKELSVGQILPGRVTKISERQVIISLSDTLVGAIDLIDLADDYTNANPASYVKNEIVRVCVVRIDEANKKISLSTRPSRILSSSLAVEDPEVNSVEDLEVNDIYRGFIRNVDDKGVFITLGHGTTAYVRVGQLSDAYLKEWKDGFQRDQLVKGKIISVDKSSGHVQMSLKASVLVTDYVAPVRFTDLKVGDILTGKVAKVESFGVFIVIDNSENVRGLCHRSEIAEKRIEDASSLFKVGDAVKAKVLKVDVDKRRVNFGLKASYFSKDELDDEDTPMSDDASAEEDSDEDDADEMEVDGSEGGGIALDGLLDDSAMDEDIPEDAADSSDEDAQAPPPSAATTLKVGGFDWHGLSSQATKRAGPAADSDSEAVQEKPKKRKKRAEIQVDRTGDLDAHGPQSADDFERLLLGEPDSSLLWLQYMAFHINLGDVDQARQIGERALKSIGLGQDAEKQNIWVALLNLEVEYGDDASLDAIFKRTCEYNDPQEMHSRLTSILIHTQKHDKADELFQTMLKKYTQDQRVWVNYATFLFDTKGDAEKARELLPRALQTLPKFTHLDVTSKFAQLEFKSEAGLAERGRTIFEGLISSFPKRIDLYNVLLDLEMKVGDAGQIRALFERTFTKKLKPKQAKYFFKRWLAFEEQEGDEQKIEEVKVKAATWIRGAGQQE